jgi:hypothetical protein
MFYPMITRILEQLPGGVSIPVEYPAGPDQKTLSGESFIIETVVQGLRNCPEQKYGLFGYSQGATVVLRALSNLSPEALDAVSSVILLGNPYRLPGKPSNVNGAGMPGNDASVGMFVNQALNNNETVPELSDELERRGIALDYCLEVSF